MKVLKVSTILLVGLSSSTPCTEIVNSDFASSAGGGVPTGWLTALGRIASNSGSTTEILTTTDGDGVTLRNSPSTTQFLQLHQFFSTNTDNPLFYGNGSGPLLYELEAIDVITSGDDETAPPDNAYVKLASVDETTATPEFSDTVKLVVPAFPNAEHGSLLDYVTFTTSPGSSSRQRVSLFYDGQGSMSVGSICARQITMDNVVDALVKFIARHYSYFGLRGPSRAGFVSQTSTLQNSVSQQQVSLLEAVQQVLGTLTTSDPHVYLRTVGGQVLPPPGFVTPPQSTLWEATFGVPVGRLSEVQSFRVSNDQSPFAVAGVLDLGGDGTSGQRQGVYALLTSLQGPAESYVQMGQALNELLQKAEEREIILDLRYNPGGAEAHGLQILQDILAAGATDPSMKRNVLYATNSYRLDPEDTDLFYQVSRQPVAVAKDSRTRMVVLISRNCVSSCEGFVLALQAAGATLIGENTRGASGNPKSFFVPGIGHAYVSSWRASDANGVPFEVTGIAPDLVVNGTVTTTADPVLDEAIRYLDETANPGGGDPPSASPILQLSVRSLLFVTWLTAFLWSSKDDSEVRTISAAAP